MARKKCGKSRFRRFLSCAPPAVTAAGVRPAEFRAFTRAHVLAWRKELEQVALSPASIRRKLSALSDLFDYLCDKNAITPSASNRNQK